MEAKTVYLETSEVSYLTNRSSRDLIVAGPQVSTREWWDGANLDRVQVIKGWLDAALDDV